MTDDQVKEENVDSSYIHKGFISAVSLLDDLMKIFVTLGTFTRVIFINLLSQK